MERPTTGTPERQIARPHRGPPHQPTPPRLPSRRVRQPHPTGPKRPLCDPRAVIPGRPGRPKPVRATPGGPGHRDDPGTPGRSSQPSTQSGRAGRRRGTGPRGERLRHLQPRYRRNGRAGAQHDGGVVHRPPAGRLCRRGHGQNSDAGDQRAASDWKQCGLLRSARGTRAHPNPGAGRGLLTSPCGRRDESRFANHRLGGGTRAWTCVSGHSPTRRDQEARVLPDSQEAD